MFRAARIHLSFFIGIIAFLTFPTAESNGQNPSENWAKAAELNLKALPLITSKKFDSAIEVLSKAIEIEPKFADAHVNLGTAYMLSDRPEIGLGHIKRSIELDPTSHIGYNQLGVTYDKLGRSGLAIEALEKAVKLNPRYAIGHINLGKVYLGANRLKKAEAAFEKGLKLDPSRESEKLYLAALYAKQERYSDAIAVARPLAERQPGNDEANLMLCKLYVLANDRDAALQMYQSFKATNTSLADEMFRSIFGGQIIDASKRARP